MQAKQKIFDSHFHIIDYNHPVYENNGFKPDEFKVQKYRRQTAELNIVGGAVVSGSFQKFDQGYLLEALNQLGEGFVGVTQVPVSVTDQELHSLSLKGVRAVRFNLKRGGSAGLEHLEELANRAWDIAGMHSEIYVDSRDLTDLYETLIKLPAISIDHLGMHSEGLDILLKLVERGCKVKATGFGRIELDPAVAIKEILKVDPSSVFVGTDLPSTRADRPFAVEDFDLIAEVAEEHAEAVFYDNAAEYYRILK